MNDFDKMLREKAAEEKIVMPESAKKQLEETLAVLPSKSMKIKRFHPAARIAAAAACLVFVLLFVMPNISTAYAAAMEKVPVLGDIVHVITIRNYYSDSNHEMDIEAPNIADSTEGNGAQFINKDVDEIINGLMKQFYADLEIDGDLGHGSVYVDYTIEANNERWFTLKLSVHMVSGSSTSYFKYYHVDKKTGELVNLSDLFNTDSFSGVLTENIIGQMRRQMKEDPSKVYWIDKESFSGDFASVDGKHNYYFNKDGNLVIPFDKYEVGPGSMGCPEFVIEMDSIQNIVKPEYRNIKP